MYSTQGKQHMTAIMKRSFGQVDLLCSILHHDITNMDGSRRKEKVFRHYHS